MPPSTTSTPPPEPPVVDVAGPEGRRRILDAAAEAFLNRGYAATTLRQIADAVGMKAGSLYYHFESKDELLTAVLQRGIAVMEEAFTVAEAAAASRDPQGRLEAHVRAHLGALFEHGPYTAAHVTTFHTAPPAVRRRVVPLRDAYERRWADLFAELARGGHLDPGVDPRLARLLLFGAMNTTIEWFRPDGELDLDALAGAVTRQTWRGLAADPHGEAAR